MVPSPTTSSSSVHQKVDRQYSIMSFRFLTTKASTIYKLAKSSTPTTHKDPNRRKTEASSAPSTDNTKSFAQDKATTSSEDILRQHSTHNKTAKLNSNSPSVADATTLKPDPSHFRLVEDLNLPPSIFEQQFYEPPNIPDKFTDQGVETFQQSCASTDAENDRLRANELQSATAANDRGDLQKAIHQLISTISNETKRQESQKTEERQFLADHIVWSNARSEASDEAMVQAIQKQSDLQQCLKKAVTSLAEVGELADAGMAVRLRSLSKFARRAGILKPDSQDAEDELTAAGLRPGDVVCHFSSVAKDAKYLALGNLNGLYVWKETFKQKYGLQLKEWGDLPQDLRFKLERIADVHGDIAALPYEEGDRFNRDPNGQTTRRNYLNQLKATIQQAVSNEQLTIDNRTNDMVNRANRWFLGFKGASGSRKP
ncbi:MAG: hypothetical protein Q9227_009568 [Pyrenula ochraceoflavens]